MKTGDAQIGHKVPEAVAVQIAAVNQPDASAHDWHQFGLSLAELAMSARRAELDGWFDVYKAYLEAAARCFGKALDCAGDDNRSLSLGIQCYLALNIARMTLDYEMVREAISLLLNVIDELKKLDMDKAVYHQTAVAMSMLARIILADEQMAMHCSWNLDYAESSQTWCSTAEEFFMSERRDSPDNRQAWRDMLIALTHGKAYKEEAFRISLIKPLVSAIVNGDRDHTAKCLAMIAFGLRGERWLCRHRYGKFLELYSTPAEIPGFPKLS